MSVASTIMSMASIIMSVVALRYYSKSDERVFKMSLQTNEILLKKLKERR